MSERAARTYTLEVDLPADATDAESSHVIGEVQEAGYISGVTVIPKAAITGANTNSRSLNVVNKGADGNGTTEVASIDFTTGVNAGDFDEVALTLAAAADLDVAAGDVLAVDSLAPGTGLAFPGGKLVVTLSRHES